MTLSLADMDDTGTQIAELAAKAGNDAGSISRLLAHLAGLPCKTAEEGRRILMEMKVLCLLRENLLAHEGEGKVSVKRFPEIPEIFVSRGVFSPEFASDSYIWAKHIAGRGVVRGKSVLEMGAGSGIISFLLDALSPPAFLCAVDVNPLAVENLRENAANFGLEAGRFLAIEGDLFASVPRHLCFDVAIWAMPWILRDDPETECILFAEEDPIKRALLWSAVDPGGRTIKRFLTDAKPFLNPGGKILLISAEFIPNNIIYEHACSEGYEVRREFFGSGVTVVENPEITLDLLHIELTKG